MEPLTLHSHAGPNPWKCVIVLEELSLPYKVKVWATPDLKTPPFITDLNPNGFVPVLEDPNTGIRLWESGAIIDYLVARYDTQHKLSFPASSLKELALVGQYSYFQATFQGPNLSSALRFGLFTPNAEARKPYVAESIRVLAVLEVELKDKEWLVGDKYSVADLVFVPYNWSRDFILGEDKVDVSQHYPNVAAWLQRMAAREAVVKTLEQRNAAFAAASIHRK